MWTQDQFSTGVRCGNWVEDTVGGVLAKQHLRDGPAGYKGAKMKPNSIMMTL